VVQSVSRETLILYSTKKKHHLPPFLDLNPDVCKAIRDYAMANLGILSIEMMSQYIHTVILPEMIRKEIESNNQPLEINQLLKQYNLTCICLSTVYKWLKRLGFSYEPRKKSYYVDGHKREATINYRWRFIERYLTYERRMFRWI